MARRGLVRRGPPPVLSGAWADVGVLALLIVAVLVGVEIKLRALCIYCTVAHVIGVITAVLLLGL